MHDPYTILRRPLITEKNMNRAEYRREYTFEVDRKANKIEIRHAIESLYNVKVLGVRTMMSKGLIRRVGHYKVEDTNRKKAVVTLAEGYKIDLI